MHHRPVFIIYGRVQAASLGYSKATVWSLDLDLRIVKEVAGNTVLYLRMKLGRPYLVSKWYSRLGFKN